MMPDGGLSCGGVSRDCVGRGGLLCVVEEPF